MISTFSSGGGWISLVVFTGTSHSLKTLHSILSTGSPLKPDTFDYVYERIKSDLLLGSITGTSRRRSSPIAICHNSDNRKYGLAFSLSVLIQPLQSNVSLFIFSVINKKLHWPMEI